LVYGFSLHFLQRGIDSWFNVQVDRGLEDALELSRTALDLRMREVLKQTARTAERCWIATASRLGRQLDAQLDLGEASELTLFGQGGRIIATATMDPMAMLPHSPPETVLLQVRQGRAYVGLEPTGETGFHIRVVVSAGRVGNEERLLQALIPVTDRLSLLADAVQAAFDSYRELTFLRAPLKVSFTLTLCSLCCLRCWPRSGLRFIQRGDWCDHCGNWRMAPKRSPPASSTNNWPAPAAMSWDFLWNPSTR
jgi:nitrogen fixation/metabolism regulation signal transduction histidine kinase